MDSKDVRKILAGLSMAALLAGSGLAGCTPGSAPPPAHQETGGSG